MASSNGPFAGVISPEVCWSAHENELRIHSTVHLEPHAGHGTTGLPEQVVFCFNALPASSTASRETPRASETDNFVLVPGEGTAVFGPRAASVDFHASGKLMVRDVTTCELKDGQTILLCLVSSPGLPSEIHCIDHDRRKVIRVVTELPIMLTRLAALPTPECLPTWTRKALGALPQPRRSLDFGSEAEQQENRAKLIPLGVTAQPAGNEVDDRGGDCGEVDDVVVAVGGLGGRVALVGMQLNHQHEQTPATAASSIRRRARRPAAGTGKVPSEREGIPITALSAFLVPWGRGTVGRIMVAAGWEDGQWAVCSSYEGAWGSGARKACAAGRGGSEEFTGDTNGLDSSSVLHFVYQRHPLGNDTEVPANYRLWVTTALGFLLFEVPRESSSTTRFSIEPLCLQRRTLASGVRPQCLRAMAVGGGPSRELVTFAAFRTSDTTPILVVVDAEKTAAKAVACKTDHSASVILDKGSDPISRRHSKRTEVLKKSGTSSRAVVRTATDHIDEGCSSSGCGNCSSAGAAQWPGSGALITADEVELSTRCCGNSVVTARPHAVWVNPAEVKIFSNGGSDGFAAESAMVERRSEEGIDSSGDGMGAVSKSAAACSALRFGDERVDLKLSITITEASLSETGRARVRAWEHFHVGEALRVGRKLEGFGHLAFCDPSQEPFWDTDTARFITDVGYQSLGHIVGGQQKLWGQAVHLKRSMKTSADASRTADSDGWTAASKNDEQETGAMTLLAARLQGAVLLGQGPAVARALTSTIVGGGEWTLPRAEPVQEWAVVVAFEAWQETCDRLSPRGSGQSPQHSGEHAALERLVRRAKQVERILEASMERCRQYCEAAAVAATLSVGTGALFRRSVTAQQHTARVTATAPLRMQLGRATVAVKLTRRLCAAAAFVLALGVDRHCTGLSSHTGREENIPALFARLRELAELTAVDCPHHNTHIGSFSAIMKLTKLVRNTFGEVGRPRSQGESSGGMDEDEALELAERGLVTVGYSVMGAAYARERSWRISGEREDAHNHETEGSRALQVADSKFELFCEQVQLSPSARMRARLCWLLDNRSSMSAALPAAASSLLYPRAVASLTCDAELAFRAAGALTDDAGTDRTNSGRKRRTFAPLAQELLRASGYPVSNSSIPRADDASTVPFGCLPDSKRSRGSLSPRLPGSPITSHGRMLALSPHQEDEKDQSSQWHTPSGGADKIRHAVSGDKSIVDRSHKGRRERGQTVWATPRGVGLTPRPENRQQQPDAENANIMEPSRGRRDGGSFGETPVRRQRGQTVWQTPRGVGLTPASASTNERRQRVGAAETASTPLRGEESLKGTRRARGQTVWQTPRGVGLTPKTSGGGDRNSGSGPLDEEHNLVGGDQTGPVSVEQGRRLRGQTVWQTPRGVGLTPAARDSWSRSDREGAIQQRGHATYVTPQTPRHRNSGHFDLSNRRSVLGSGTKSGMMDSAARADDQQHAVRRARGQTIWQTPRGVGLTPKVPQGNSVAAATPRSAKTRLRNSSDSGRFERALSGLNTPDAVGSRFGKTGLRSFTEGH